ncbi:hypothetical protein JCM10212_000718 [Sporobolomyces blumeae]
MRFSPIASFVSLLLVSSSSSSSSLASAARLAPNAKPDVDVSASFPPSNPFGRVTNGPTGLSNHNVLSVSISSHHSEPLSITEVSGEYFESTQDGRERPLRKTTTQPIKGSVQPGARQKLAYRFHSENKPGHDVGLRVKVQLVDPATRKKHDYVAYEGQVSVVEPEGTWFDLELIALYLILAGFFGSIAYVVYTSYLSPPSSSSPSKKSGTSKRDPRSSSNKHTSVVAKDDEIRDSNEAAAAAQATALDEDWIPRHHLAQQRKSSGRK